MPSRTSRMSDAPISIACLYGSLLISSTASLKLYPINALPQRISSGSKVVRPLQRQSLRSILVSICPYHKRDLNLDLDAALRDPISEQVILTWDPDYRAEQAEGTAEEEDEQDWEDEDGSVHSSDKSIVELSSMSTVKRRISAVTESMLSPLMSMNAHSAHIGQ
jgi:hypothetical protein